MRRRPTRSTRVRSSAASDVYKRQATDSDDVLATCSELGTDLEADAFVSACNQGGWHFGAPVAGVKRKLNLPIGPVGVDPGLSLCSTDASLNNACRHEVALIASSYGLQVFIWKPGGTR